MVDERIKSLVGCSKNLLDNGQTPCFFINGSSELGLLENYALELVGELESNLAFFKGIVKYFAVKMPHINSSKEQNSFTEKVLESISIARDCYNEFRGIIIIELDQLWNASGANEHFSCVNQVFNSFPKNCYIVVAAGKENTNKMKSIKSQLSESCILIDAAIPEFDLQFFSNLFVSAALDMGYSVTDAAKNQMKHYLSEMRWVTKDVKRLVMQTLFQIDIAKKLSEDNRVIDELDVINLPGRRERVPEKTKIGFAPYKA